MNISNSIINVVRAFRSAFGIYKKVYFNDLTRVEPVSSVFGLDRGTPIDRHYIQKFLSSNKKDIRGTILEIAEDTYSRKYACSDSGNTFETLHYDGKESSTTIIGDLTNPEGLPRNRYDCFICTQTYHVIFDVSKAIEGSYRLLKEGGVVLATVCGISQISRYDMDRWGDYWRFTNKSAERLFKDAGFSDVETVIMGNSLAATAFLQGLAIEDLPRKELLDITDENYQMIIGIRAKK